MRGANTSDVLVLGMEIVQKNGLIFKKGHCQVCMGWQMEAVEHFYYFPSGLNTICVTTVLD